MFHSSNLTQLLHSDPTDFHCVDQSAHLIIAARPTSTLAHVSASYSYCIDITLLESVGLASDLGSFGTIQRQMS